MRLRCSAKAQWRVLAGGTDFYPALGVKAAHGKTCSTSTGSPNCEASPRPPTHFVIGARTTGPISSRAALPPAFDALRQAAREVGSVQIQNTGTVAGNLCNASPAADGVPPLLILDAEVELRSLGGTRHCRWATLSCGNRRTACARRNGDCDPRAEELGRPARRLSRSSARGATWSSPSPWPPCGLPSARTAASPTPPSRSAPARRWPSACPAWKRRCVGRPAGPALRRLVAERAFRRADADRRRARQRGIPAATPRARSSGARCHCRCERPMPAPERVGRMSRRATIDFEVNGAAVSVDVPPVARLSSVLRDELRLTGTKVGCDAGDCGACTVLLDGEPVCACLVPVASAAGRKVRPSKGSPTAGCRRCRRLSSSMARPNAASARRGC